LAMKLSRKSFQYRGNWLPTRLLSPRAQSKK
jgi:hypothetical protein